MNRYLYLMAMALLGVSSLFAEDGISMRASKPTGNAAAKVIHVSALKGADSNAGSLMAPFATIAKAIEVLDAGDTCYIHKGIYRETIAPKYNGTATAPIVFTNYKNDTVTISGAEVLNLKWEVYKGSIYKAHTSANFSQLLINGVHMNEARWPNTDTKNLVVMNRAYIDNSEPAGETARTVFYDDALPPGDWTGAYAVYSNNATFQRKITGYIPGVSMTFDTPVFTANNKVASTEKNKIYWLYGPLFALDAAGEWHLNTVTDTLCLWAPGGNSPKNYEVEYGARAHVVNCQGCRHIVIDGLNLYVGSVNMKNAQFCTLKNSNQRYAYWSRIANNNEDENSFDQATENFISGNGNVWENNLICHSASSGIYISGSNHKIINNHISDVGLMQVKAACVKIKNVQNIIVERNTLERSAKRALQHSLCQNVKVRLNLMRYGGLLSAFDGGLSYGNEVKDDSTLVDRIQLSYNWLHYYGFSRDPDSGSGIYWDGKSNHCLAHHNVLWDFYRGPIRANNKPFDDDKPEADALNHRFYHNMMLKTGLDTTAMKLNPDCGDYPTWSGYYFLSANQNKEGFFGTQFYNNMGEGTAKWNRFKNYVPAGDSIYMANAFDIEEENELLVDRTMYDFRPRKGSPLIDCAVDLSEIASDHIANFPRKIGDKYDMAAYEYGSSSYWIPGRKLSQVSCPIPHDGALNMPLDRDLIFLNGYKAISANVYFGTSKSAVNNANVQSEAFLVNVDDSINVICLKNYGVTLKGVTTYYWRVDAVSDNGVMKGEVYSFTTVFTSGLSPFLGDIKAKFCSIFPNPAKTSVNIVLTVPDAHVSLFSLEGKVLLTEYISNTNYILDISTIKAGIYLLQVEHDGVSSNVKLLVGN